MKFCEDNVFETRRHTKLCIFIPLDDSLMKGTALLKIHRVKALSWLSPVHTHEEKTCHSASAILALVHQKMRRILQLAVNVPSAEMGRCRITARMLQGGHVSGGIVVMSA
jgi:hypothetical protein